MDESVLQDAQTVARLLPMLLRRFYPRGRDDAAGGLPLAQLRLCVALERRDWTITELSRELNLSVSAVVQTADRVERLGLVESSREPADRRVRKLRLSPAGTEMMASRSRVRAQRVAYALDLLDPVDRSAVVRAMEQLVAAGDRVLADMSEVGVA